MRIVIIKGSACRVPTVQSTPGCIVGRLIWLQTVLAITDSGKLSRLENDFGNAIRESIGLDPVQNYGSYSNLSFKGLPTGFCVNNTGQLVQSDLFEPAI